MGWTPIPWRDSQTGDMLELRAYGGTPRADELERLIEEARQRKALDVQPPMSPNQLGREALGEAAEWTMDAPVLKPISDKLREPGVKTAARLLVPGFAGGEAILGGIAGAGATVGTMWDKMPGEGLSEADIEIIKEEAGEGIHTGMEMVAPVDVAAIGFTGAAGIAAKMAKTAKGLQGARALGQAGRVADISEGIYGAGQVQEGLAEDDWAMTGIGAARMAGGFGGALSIPDVPNPSRVMPEPLKAVEDLTRWIPEDISSGRAFDPVEWGPETGAVEFGGGRPPVPDGHTRFFRGGEEGSSFFAKNEARAGSYASDAGEGVYVDVPDELVPDFHAAAAQQPGAMPTPDDIYLPNDWVKKTQPTILKTERPEIVASESMEDILKDLEVEELGAPPRTGSEAPEQGTQIAIRPEGVEPVQQGVQGVQEGVQGSRIAGGRPEGGPLEFRRRPPAPEKDALEETIDDILGVEGFRVAPEFRGLDPDLKQRLGDSTSEDLRAELEQFEGYEPSDFDRIDRESKEFIEGILKEREGREADILPGKFEDVEPYDQVPDDVARVEADADAAILEADIKKGFPDETESGAVVPIKNLRLRQVTADSGRLDLALDKGTTSPDMIEQMLKDQFPEHSIEVAPMKAGLGWGKEVDLHHVTFWKDGRLDYKAAERAQELLGGKLLREAPGMETAKPPVRPAAAPEADAGVSLKAEDQGFLYHSTDRAEDLKGILDKGLRTGHVSDIKGQGTSGPYTVVYGKDAGDVLEDVSYRPGDKMGKLEPRKPRAILVDPEAFMESPALEALENTMKTAFDAQEVVWKKWKVPYKKSPRGGDIPDFEAMGGDSFNQMRMDPEYKRISRVYDEASDDYYRAADNEAYHPKTYDDYFNEAKAIADEHGIPVVRAKMGDEGDLMIPKGALADAEPPIKPPAKPALEAAVPAAKGQSYTEFMQEKFGDKRTTAKERAIAKAEWKQGSADRKIITEAEAAGIPPDKVKAMLKEHPPDTPGPESVSPFKRAVLPLIKVFEKISPKLGAKFRTYTDLSEGPAMEKIAETFKMKKTLNKKQQKSVIESMVELDQHPERAFTDIEFVDPQVREAVAKIRGMLDEAWEDAVQAGVRTPLDKKRSNYFPHKFAEGWEDEALQSPNISEQWEVIDPHLEKKRLTGRSDFRRDWDVLDEYFLGVYRRNAEVHTFGKGLKGLKGFMKKELAGLDEANREYVRTNARRILGREPEGMKGRVAAKARHLEALSDLGLAAFYQPIQGVNVGLHGGFIRSTRALGRLLKDYPEETYRAIKSGALTPNIIQEVAAAHGGGGLGGPKFSKFMYGIPTVDKMTRVTGNTAGRLLVEDAISGKWFKQSKGAIKDIRGLGIEGEIVNTPEFINKVGKALSDKALFRTGGIEVPGWASSTGGKLGTQYMRFMYRHSIMVTELFSEAAKGNIKPLARFLTVAPAAITGMAEVLMPIREGLRDLIKQSFQEGDYDLDQTTKAAFGSDKDWDEEAEWIDIFRNKRIPWSHPLYRSLQNMAMWGGIGVYQMMTERIFRGYSATTRGMQWLGPVVGTAVEGLGAASMDVERATEGKWPEAFPKWALEQLPVGGYTARKTLFSPEEKKKKYGPKSSSKGGPKGGPKR